MADLSNYFCPLIIKFTSQTKIALKCDSEEELLILQAQARSLNLCSRSIQDAFVTFTFPFDEF